MTVALPLLALLACSGDMPTSPYDLTDTHGYTYQGTLDAPTLVTKAESDVEICWDGLAQDIQCHDLDAAADVDNLGLVRFQHLTEPDVEERMAEDDLDQADTSGYVEWRNDDELTCAHLEDFSLFGTPLDVADEYHEEAGTYLLLLTTGTSVGTGARMIAFLQPDSSSDVTRVEVPDGCGVLSFEVDLHSQEPVRVAAEASSWEVRWDDVATNGMGLGFDAGVVDSLMLGFYAGKTTSDLEEGFLDLEVSSDAMYTLPHEAGTSADLADAVDLSGAAFPGFDDLDGTWILALRCSRCYNPAPPYLVVLEPVEAK